MKKRTMILLFATGMAATAGGALAAPPAPHSSDTPHADRAPSGNQDEVHITVSAGRGRLGITAIQISPELRAYLGGPSDRGVLVDSVRPDSPAAQAGLRVGDLVLAVDGKATRSAGDMLEAMSDRKKGDRVDLDVMRGGHLVKLTATLEDDGLPMPRFGGFGSFGRFGNVPESLLQDLGWELGLDKDPGPGRTDLQRQLDDARRHMEEMEKRLERLERT